MVRIGQLPRFFGRSKQDQTERQMAQPIDVIDVDTPFIEPKDNERKRVRDDVPAPPPPPPEQPKTPKVPNGLDLTLLQNWVSEWLVYAGMKNWNAFTVSQMMTSVVVTKGKRRPNPRPYVPSTPKPEGVEKNDH